MGMTMTQKILAAHAGLDAVRAGDLIEAKLDIVLGNDVTTPVAVDVFDKAGFSRVFDKEKIAIVLDEYGGVHGLVTFTDLVECLVGEFDVVEDESTEESEPIIEKLEDDPWQINGGASLEEVAEALEIEINDEDIRKFTTVGDVVAYLETL